MAGSVRGAICEFLSGRAVPASTCPLVGPDLEGSTMSLHRTGLMAITTTVLTLMAPV